MKVPRFGFLQIKNVDAVVDERAAGIITIIVADSGSRSNDVDGYKAPPRQ